MDVPSSSDCVELNVFIDRCNLIPEISKVVSVLRPCWSTENIKYKVFSNGITNKLVGVTHCVEREETILVRVYGENTEKIIDRALEIKTLKALHQVEFGPKLYAVFLNGLAYQFLKGDILTVDTCRADHIYPLVVKTTVQLHQLIGKIFVDNLSSSESRLPKPMLWEKIRRFIDLSPECFHDESRQQRYQAEVPSKGDLMKELTWMQDVLGQLNNPIVFCHNDLLLANIIFDSDSNSVHFIDFEYAAPNYQAYDIANHFCEFAGVDDYEPSRYPDEEFRRAWISAYLKEFLGSQNVDQSCVNRLTEHVEKFSIAAHFFWGVWSLVQAGSSTIDFDFLGYSILRLQEYFKKKEVLSGTTGFGVANSSIHHSL